MVADQDLYREHDRFQPRRAARHGRRLPAAALCWIAAPIRAQRLALANGAWARAGQRMGRPARRSLATTRDSVGGMRERRATHHGTAHASADRRPLPAEAVKWRHVRCDHRAMGPRRFQVAGHLTCFTQPAADAKCAWRYLAARL